MTRCGGGFGESAIGATKTERSARSGWPGKSDAVWPSGPIPRSARSSCVAAPARRAREAPRAARSRTPPPPRRAGGRRRGRCCSFGTPAASSSALRHAPRFESGIVDRDKPLVREEDDPLVKRRARAACASSGAPRMVGIEPPESATQKAPRAPIAASAAATISGGARAASAAVEPKTSCVRAPCDGASPGTASVAICAASAASAAPGAGVLAAAAAAGAGVGAVEPPSMPRAPRARRRRAGAPRRAG